MGALIGMGIDELLPALAGSEGARRAAEGIALPRIVLGEEAELPARVESALWDVLLSLGLAATWLGRKRTPLTGAQWRALLEMVHILVTIHGPGPVRPAFPEM